MVWDVFECRMFKILGIFEWWLIFKLLSVKYIIWGFYLVYFNSNMVCLMLLRFLLIVSFLIFFWDCGKMRIFFKIVSDNWIVWVYIIFFCLKINVILILSFCMECLECSFFMFFFFRGLLMNDFRFDILGLIVKVVCLVYVGVFCNFIK